MEQWKWTLCLLITGAKLCIEDAKSPPMHSMWKPRAPFTVLPTKERRCMMGPSEASFMQTTQKVADLLHRRRQDPRNTLKVATWTRTATKKARTRTRTMKRSRTLYMPTTLRSTTARGFSFSYIISRAQTTRCPQRYKRKPRLRALRSSASAWRNQAGLVISCKMTPTIHIWGGLTTGTLMHTTQGFHARPFRNFDSGLQRD